MDWVFSFKRARNLKAGVAGCLILLLAVVFVWEGLSFAQGKGNPAPDFTLKSISGQNIKLSELRGQVVLVNFWATWCAPCKEELPFFNRLYSKNKVAGLEILAVNIDKFSSQAKTFSQNLGLSFPILLDSSGKVSASYRIHTMPTTAVVSKDGTIRFIHRGFIPSDRTRYDQEIRMLLRE